MTAAAVAPTTSISTTRRTCVTRLTMLIALKGLPDAEVHPVAPRLRAAVHDQLRRRVQSIADGEADRTDRGRVAEAGTDGIPEVAEPEAHGRRPDVAAIEKQDAA